jgi:hypothetical protein
MRHLERHNVAFECSNRMWRSWDPRCALPHRRRRLCEPPKTQSALFSSEESAHATLTWHSCARK